MPEERPRFGRYDQRDESGPCAASGRHAHNGCPRCAAQLLRPYRVVKRYRGDRAARDLTPSDWCKLWSMRTSDVSWPGFRRS
jgi:hypothetical protein